MMLPRCFQTRNCWWWWLDWSRGMDQGSWNLSQDWSVASGVLPPPSCSPCRWPARNVLLLLWSWWLTRQGRSYNLWLLSCLLTHPPPRYLTTYMSSDLLYLLIVFTFITIKLAALVADPIDPFQPLEQLGAYLVFGGLWDGIRGGYKIKKVEWIFFLHIKIKYESIKQQQKHVYLEFFLTILFRMCLANFQSNERFANVVLQLIMLCAIFLYSWNIFKHKCYFSLLTKWTSFNKVWRKSSYILFCNFSYGLQSLSHPQTKWNIVSTRLSKTW